MRALLVAAVMAGPASAQEFVTVDTPLSDEAFYRAVACGAPADGACAKPFLRWPEARRDPLRIGLVSIAERVGPSRRAAFEAALDAAIAEVNAAAGPALRVERDDDGPDVAVHVVAAPPYTVIEGTGEQSLDGAPLQLGRVALTSRGGTVVHGAIAVSMHLPKRVLASVLLEEVTQATGLMTDLAGSAYPESVFAEDGNRAVRLVGQDAMAVRRHYEEAG